MQTATRHAHPPPFMLVGLLALSLLWAGALAIAF
jgi:hypothetical protein